MDSAYNKEHFDIYMIHVYSFFLTSLLKIVFGIVYVYVECMFMMHIYIHQIWYFNLFNVLV